MFREQWKPKPYQALLVSACNPSIWEVKAGDQDYKVILSYTVQSQSNQTNQTRPPQLTASQMATLHLIPKLHVSVLISQAQSPGDILVLRPKATVEPLMKISKCLPSPGCFPPISIRSWIPRKSLFSGSPHSHTPRLPFPKL